MADPIHQFEIHSLVPLGHIGGHEFAFTNSALFMAITVVGVVYIVFTLVIWVIGVIAIAMLWRSESSAYFKSSSALR